LEDHPFDTTRGISFDHADWTTVLQQHVSVKAGQTIDGILNVATVDYDGIRDDPKFQAYLQKLQLCDPTQLQLTEQVAFWMNAYNAYCINLIVQHEASSGTKISSINDLSTKETVVWNNPKAGFVNGQAVSLNHIEHDQLRRRFADARVHACIVCASASCPNLRNEAFDARTLSAQMDEQMQNWMSNDSKGICWNSQTKKLDLSRIFLWFAEDFGQMNGIREFLMPYVTNNETVQGKLRQKAPVRYFEYSWKINRTPQS
jgi:Protein of unknown function, DUF547